MRSVSLEMLIKWMAKAILVSVAALIGVLYPEKMVAVGLLIAHSVWDIAVMIGEQFRVPGEDKVQAAAAVLLLPLRASRFNPDQETL